MPAQEPLWQTYLFRFWRARRVVPYGRGRPFCCHIRKCIFSFVIPCTQGDLAELGSYADKEMREEWAWCRQLNGGDKTPVARYSREGWSEVPMSKCLRVSVMVSNSFWCIHTLDLPFCSYSDIPNTSLMKATHAQPQTAGLMKAKPITVLSKPTTIAAYCSAAASTATYTWTIWLPRDGIAPTDFIRWPSTYTMER